MATFGQFYEMGPFFSGGNLVAGAKVYHYIAGTNTLLNVYTDRAKSTPAAQPVVADSQGIASFYGDGIYKLVVADPTNVADPPTIVLYTFDNVNLSDTSSTTGKGANLASASTIVLGSDGDEFVVTGAVAIDKLSGPQSRITLTFASTPTLNYSGNLLLAGGISYTAAINDVMVFANEGLSGGNYIFREVSRLTYIPAVGAAGTIPMSITAATNKTAYVAALNKQLNGFTYANNGTDNLDLTAGGAMDATWAYWMTGAALTKQTNVVWAVGTNAGMLDTGAIGNNDYYIWVIARTDTGIVDYLCSLSSTTPTMPTSYTMKRLIGWFKRVAGAVVAFHTYETEGGGIEMNWDVPTLDVNLAATLTTTRRTDAVKVPLLFSVTAHLNVVITSGVTTNIWICCPDQTDAAPSATVAPLGNHLTTNTAAFTLQLRVRTSAAGLIAARANQVNVPTYAVSTMGFTWARRT